MVGRLQISVRTRSPAEIWSGTCVRWSNGSGFRSHGADGAGAKNESAPVGAPACAVAPPGAARGQGPPQLERRALAFDSTCSHRPSRLAAWRAMPRFGSVTGCPASNPSAPSTPTRSPEPSVLVPIGTVLAESSWGGPSSSGSSPLLRCPPPPEDVGAPDCLAGSSASPGRPGSTHAPAGLRRPPPPEGAGGPGLTRRPHRSPGSVADPSLPPLSRRRPTTRFGVAVNTVRVPIPLGLVSGVGWAEAPSSPPRSACALRNEHQ